MIAVTYWEGWVLAHPAAVLIAAACAGTLAVLVLLMRAEDRRDDRAAGLPPAPRRGLRSRARGTRARRHLPASLRRRARAMTAWGTSWGRRAIALRIKGITIDVGHAPTNQARDLEPPNELPTQLGVGVSTEPTRLATDAERDQAGIPAPWYAPELAPPAALSPWEHQTMWFTLGAIDADIQARAAAGGDA